METTYFELKLIQVAAALSYVQSIITILILKQTFFLVQSFRGRTQFPIDIPKYRKKSA